LYRAVAKAKTALSASDMVHVELKMGRKHISESVSRADFESWIAGDLDDIDGCVSEALVAAELDEGGIDRVFLTGGSSFVPAVKARFDRRFPDRASSRLLRLWRLVPVWQCARDRLYRLRDVLGVEPAVRRGGVGLLRRGVRPGHHRRDGYRGGNRKA